MYSSKYNFCVLHFIPIIFSMFVIFTININGLNCRDKQLQVINFMRYYKIDILLVQEHNIRNISVISNELNDFCHICINLAICLKGGTAIFIDRKLPFNILSEELSADSRIISLKLKLYNQILHIVNVYAHSGNRATERDSLFNNDLIYYLRNNLQNTFIGGDWNCVLSERDKSSENVIVSKSLLNVVRTLNLKDIWFLKHRNIEFTYVRNNFGSRIDRAYVNGLSNYISNVKHVNINFSDHSGLYAELNLPNVPTIGKSYWKMNISLLNDIDIKDSFKLKWASLCLDKNKFENINVWWDTHVKKEIKFFFIKEGKKLMDKKYSLIKYLEFSLNRLYNNLSITGTMQYGKVRALKDRIDILKNEILDGVKIRGRIKEQEEGEKVSAYLIKQQSNVKAKKLLNCIKTEINVMDNMDPGIVLNDKDSVSLYIYNYYKKTV